MPIVIEPRYTPYAGKSPFLVIAMDTTKYPTVPFSDGREKPAE